MGDLAVVTDLSEARRFVIVGGAGFIGSHFVEHLLSLYAVESVVVYDNLSSGSRAHLEGHAGDARLRVVEADVRDFDLLMSCCRGVDVVIHLASNPDIARAAELPTVDFDDGTALTNLVLEAARLGGARSVLYASGSGVYGDLGDLVVTEDHGPLLPISTYGASKLAGEALLAAYCHMFGLRGRAFRFANVVGPRQTHGVGHDFLRRLLVNPTELRILGDGGQSKPYIHVHDIVEAVLLTLTAETRAYQVYNVAPTDHLTVREIADLTVQVLGLDPKTVAYRFSGGDRGWSGDVPIVRMDTARMRGLGWSPRYSSRQAMTSALRAMRAEVQGSAVK